MPDSYRHVVVAADHRLASQAGVDIYRQGGNLIDVAVATSMALSVLRPASSGLGGGGFLVYWDAELQRASLFDYREKAPIRARPNLYAETGEDASLHGGLAIAVPGQIPGLCQILRTMGSLSLETVLQPAYRYATQGVELDSYECSTRARLIDQFEQHSDHQRNFGPLWEMYLHSGKKPKPGDLWKSPQSSALELLMKEGVESFKTGSGARSLLEACRGARGILEEADLARFEPSERTPILRNFEGRTAVMMPPPSSGGVVFSQTLGILESIRDFRTTLQTAESLHLIVEAWKHAFAIRASSLGDADFAKVPLREILDRRNLRELAERIDPKKTQDPKSYGRIGVADDHGTTHFSAVDHFGNAVAVTETINTEYGSYVVDPKTGIVFNNEMDDFTAHPGKPNTFGLMQSEQNAIAPGKKPLSSMSPTILIREDGKAEYVAGASGGPRIITSTMQVLCRMLWEGLSPQDAVKAPRIHHQWLPDELLVEPSIPEALRKELADRGHRIVVENSLAACQATRRTDKELTGGSDPRKNGTPAGS